MSVYVKTEHEKMQKLRVIMPVQKSSYWVSSLTCSYKTNGMLFIVLDLTYLNAAIKRDHYQTLTVKELTHEFAGSAIFTKTDRFSVMWHVVPYYELRLLTTFILISMSYPLGHMFTRNRLMPDGSDSTAG